MISTDLTNPVASALRDRLLGWYAEHGRRLSIRTLRDPYAIWVAETMSQQTQISRVEETLPGFLERFPSPGALAAASPADVIRAWAGLGYNRRAVNLWRAARVIVDVHGGELPGDVVSLAALPGVGAYTARAVAAFGFGVPVTALDTNASRVLRRALYADPLPLGESGVRAGRTFQAEADALAPHGSAAAWNHALMDVGSGICRREPACPRCPLADACAYRRQTARGGAPRTAARPGHQPRCARLEHSSRRRIRGRIVSALRTGGDGWIRVDPRAVDATAHATLDALDSLEADGLVERSPDGTARLRTRVG